MITPVDYIAARKDQAYIESRDGEILRLYRDDGLTQGAIGERFGITESRVNQILKKKFGYSKPRAPFRVVVIEKAHEQALKENYKRDLRKYQDQVIHQGWIEGLSTFELGAKLHLDPSVIGKRAHDMGLQPRRRWQTPQPITHIVIPPEDRPTPPEGAPPKPYKARPPKFEFMLKGCNLCGQENVAQCGWCAARLCEDHAYVTVWGTRCQRCIGV